jgi:hypothetical protein
MESRFDLEITSEKTRFPKLYHQSDILRSGANLSQLLERPRTDHRNIHSKPITAFHEGHERYPRNNHLLVSLDHPFLTFAWTSVIFWDDASCSMKWSCKQRPLMVAIGLSSRNPIKKPTIASQLFQCQTTVVGNRTVGLNADLKIRRKIAVFGNNMVLSARMGHPVHQLRLSDQETKINYVKWIFLFNQQRSISSNTSFWSIDKDQLHQIDLAHQ